MFYKIKVNGKTVFAGLTAEEVEMITGKIYGWSHMHSMIRNGDHITHFTKTRNGFVFTVCDDTPVEVDHLYHNTGDMIANTYTVKVGSKTYSYTHVEDGFFDDGGVMTETTEIRPLSKVFFAVKHGYKVVDKHVV